MPQKQRVRNWKAYNKALKLRGDLFLYFDENFLKKWFFDGKRKSGGVIKYSDAVIEMMLSIKNVLRLPLRQAQGFVESILKRLNLPLDTPDYTTVSRRAKTLSLKVKCFIKPNNVGPLHLAVDSTGLSVYCGAYFHRSRYNSVRKHKDGDAWKKLHVAYDLASGQIVGAYLSDSQVTDAAGLEILTKNLGARKVESIRADGAYDRANCYRAAHALSAEAIIPPIKTAKVQKKTRGHPLDEALSARDRTINLINQYEDHEEGLRIWKQESGYHERSKVEAVMHRFKMAFGASLQSRSLKTMQSEVITKINIINLHRSLGVAEYGRVT